MVEGLSKNFLIFTTVYLCRIYEKSLAAVITVFGRLLVRSALSFCPTLSHTVMV